MTSGGNVLNETRQHQPGQPVADFTISLLPSVDVCSLHVRISAGNSAGMSAPSEAIEVDCSDGSTNSPATISTESGPEDLTALIVVAVAGGVMIVALTVGILYMLCRKHRKRNKANTSGQRDTSYSQSPSLSGPVSLYMVNVTTEQTTSRDPEYTANLMETLDSTPSTLQSSVAMAPETQTQASVQTGSSTESGHSSDLLLPPSCPTPMGGSLLVYAQVNVQQTQVHPPANDDHVQYAQIEHH